MTANTMNATATVLLTGGPHTLSDDRRIVRVSTGTDKVKLQVGRGYEHFTDTGEATDGMRVFQWSDRTAIAE